MLEIGINHARAIGEKLQAARKNQNMSLRELARKAEISASMLSQIENGKAYPSVRSIYNIAAALAVPVDFFFPDTGNTPISIERDPAYAGEMTASELREVNLLQGGQATAPGFPEDGTGPSPVVKSAARPTINLKGGVGWSRLTALAEPDAEFLEITYASGASSGAEMSHHEGREFGLILEGELVLELGFERHTLKEGDSIIFNSTTPHRLVNPGPETMRAIWVVFSRP